MNPDQIPPVTNSSPPPSKELRRLVDGFLNQTLSRGEFAQLEELLDRDSVARRYYLEIAGNEALMESAIADADGQSSAPSPSGLSRFGVPLGIAAALAIVSCITLILDRGDKLILVDMPQVEVTGDIGVAWSDGSVGVAIGETLPRSGVSIENGLLELTYGNGVQLLLEGPARYEVTGANSGRLDYGSLVAEVPPGAEGFSVDYGEDRLIDHGTKFGVRMPRSLGVPEVAVFSGEVEIFPGNKKHSAHLFRDHAVRRSAEEATGLVSIPLDRSLYARELPSRELPWKMPEVPHGEEASLVFDVSELIRRGDDYRFVYKWMSGNDAIYLRDVELRLDGERIGIDTHTGLTGDVDHTERNVFTIEVDPAQFRRGRWTLHATGWCYVSERRSPAASPLSDSEGVLLVEQGPASAASAENFVGRWEYWHDGVLWVRELFEDGSAVLLKDGEIRRHPSWSVSSGVLQMYFPAVDKTEELILRDRNTLIFLDRAYRNATRSSQK